MYSRGGHEHDYALPGVISQEKSTGSSKFRPSLQDETSVWRPLHDLSQTRRAGRTRIWAQLGVGRG